ncbi:DUF917 family protein [Desulfospira joergensenii]|uniref:S-methyl thiohydantoin desulfurase domain-containing protein n=1 Tax=Desulfospira joergensenii TaxID=53329 RepID=UPI0003B72962|nr:DUF917 family protein [Desulfospira joergensenii]
MSESGTGPIVDYSQDDLYDFIEGATFLATGGGGPKDVARDFLKNSGVTSVNTLSSPKVPDQMSIACAAEVFAPSAIEAKKDYTAALKSYEGLVSPGPGKLTGVMAGEVGAINGIVPAIVAGLTDSFLISDTQTDRAVSEMDMGLFQNRVPYYYLNMLDDDGKALLQKSYPASDRDAMIVEKDVANTMKAHPELEGVGGFATYPMTGRDLKGYYSQGLLQPHTFDFARYIGACMKEPGFEPLIFNAVKEWLGSGYTPYRMFKGYLANARQVAKNQDYGMADFISSDPLSSMGARIYYSNENMIAYYTLWVLVRTVPTPIEISPMAIGPDAICYLLTSARYGNGYSFTNEAFTEDYGNPDFFKTHEIEILGFPEPTLRRTNLIANFKREITATMGAFGKTYPGSYIPIEQLQEGRIEVDLPKIPGRENQVSGMTLKGPYPGAVIRYTVDNNEPDTDSPIYEAPVPLKELAGSTVKARLFHGGSLPGPTTHIVLPKE